MSKTTTVQPGKELFPFVSKWANSQCPSSEQPDQKKRRAGKDNDNQGMAAIDSGGERIDQLGEVKTTTNPNKT